jgi:1,4-alpha-glucan branching enzyme
MILTPAELASIIQCQNRAPHQLLGMHPLGDGSGLIVRAFLENASEVEVVPTQEKDKPHFTLGKLHEAGLFEGVTYAAHRVYAYDLRIRDYQGGIREIRDPYSFLPTLGETDLFLFGQGNERRIYDKLGAQSRVIDGVSEQVSRCGHRTRSVSGSAVLTIGTDDTIRCVPWDCREFGKSLFQDRGRCALQIRDFDQQGTVAVKTDPFGFSSKRRRSRRP